jgi:hypothetical protein
MKYMDIKEFVEKGYLHEVNRLVLHPCGLALEVAATDASDGSGMLESYRLTGIQDHRDDPTGIFLTHVNREKVETVEAAMEAQRERRLANPHVDLSGIQLA